MASQRADVTCGRYPSLRQFLLYSQIVLLYVRRSSEKETPVRLPVGFVGFVATGAGKPSESEFTGVSGVAFSVYKLTNGGLRSAIELAIMFGTKLIPYPPRNTVPFPSSAWCKSGPKHVTYVVFRTST